MKKKFLKKILSAEDQHLNFIRISNNYLFGFFAKRLLQKDFGQVANQFKQNSRNKTRNEEAMEQIISQFHKVVAFAEEVVKGDDPVNKILEIEKTLL